MRRFLGLAVLLFCSLPFGVSVVGCKHALAVQYCKGFSDSGPVAGQVASIQFSTALSAVGESLSYGQIGSGLSATALDCNGANVSVSAYTYGTSDMSFADINPATGQVCAGTWNRNSGGGVPDYSVCTPPTAANSGKYLAYVTASAAGATSNPIPIYIHPTVTSVVIGTPTATTSCAAAVASPTGDPSSNCCPADNTVISATPYTGHSCVSQGQLAQLVARVYANGTTNPADNITCKVGHLTFSPQTSGSVVTIDQNGIATADQPGSTTILASISNAGSGSTAGFFSTCPPASITLSASGQTSSSIIVGLNNSQALTTTILDTNGNPITGLPLEFVSTTPQTITAASNTVSPAFPGTANITALCQPSSCNPAPFSQIGYLGNGKPIQSNPITVTATGTSSTVLFAGSTSSEFLYTRDFTTSSPGALIKLPYIPNSMVITQDGSTIYLGSSSALISVGTLGGAVGTITSGGANIQGTILAVSPDGSTLVVADAVRGTTTLYSNSGAATATYGGVGVRAQWSPDSQTVYIAAGNLLLVHSNFSGWTSTPVPVNYQDVAVTVPDVGAYFAAGTETDGRSYCATSLVGTTGTPPAVANTFYPLADASAAPTQRVAATTDGKHILGAGLTGGAAALDDIAVVFPVTSTQPGGPAACTTATAPVTFSSSFAPKLLSGITASAITGVVPASNSAVAFVTYTGSSGLLPAYAPGTGTLTLLPLTGGATLAPIAGVFSSDNSTFYAGTSGDNKIHVFSVSGTSATDASQLAPNLPDLSGNIVAPNLIVERVKRSTS